MKKFFVIFLVMFLMIGIIGCQNEKEEPKGESTKTEQSSECG